MLERQAQQRQHIGTQRVNHDRSFPIQSPHVSARQPPNGPDNHPGQHHGSQRCTTSLTTCLRTDPLLVTCARPGRPAESPSTQIDGKPCECQSDQAQCQGKPAFGTSEERRDTRREDQHSRDRRQSRTARFPSLEFEGFLVIGGAKSQPPLLQSPAVIQIEYELSGSGCTFHNRRRPTLRSGTGTPGSPNPSASAEHNADQDNPEQLARAAVQGFRLRFVATCEIQQITSKKQLQDQIQLLMPFRAEIAGGMKLRLQQYEDQENDHVRGRLRYRCGSYDHGQPK
mmetsp:Transcript_13339/g.32251  ORF Transcript_13339/g.32251 Transcript_13339/m.32251 type:complete len:284 (-) Transcript_13339:802-1653(-)